MPAEFAIDYFVSKGKKVIYTGPIKSLINQKFYDFNEKFSEYGISIGILTGDIKFAPQADCLIMTTEILLNYLLKYSSKESISENDIDFSNIACIIFDEVHYINDVDRGNVWEQSIMYIPTHIQLIMLSATLHQPEKFGNWIERVQKKKTRIITTNHRVVPLYFNIYYSMTKGLIKKVPKDKTNLIKLNELIPIASTNDKKFDDLVYQKVLKFNEFQLSKMEGYRWQANTVINEMLKKFSKQLNEENMFPLLFFVLNKKKCIELAKSISIVFNNDLEMLEVNRYIDSMVSVSSPFNYLKNMEQFDLIHKLAQKGIGIHHSGLLPVLKEMVEQLYEKKLIKVLFATETFAVGLNMPTKTVVFCDLSKYSSEGHRLLYSHEFIQMAGRAGRRNIDTQGYIILLPQLFKKQLTNQEIVHILYGGGQKIESKLNIDELFILRQLASTSLNRKTDVDLLISNIKSSMLADNTQKMILQQQNTVTKYEKIVSRISSDEMELIQELLALTNPILTLSKDKDKKKRLDTLKSNSDLMNKFNTYTKYEEAVIELSKMMNYLESAVKIELDNLVVHDMIIYDKSDDSDIILTNRGIIGSYIIDQNPIIIVDILTSDYFRKMSKPDLLTENKENIYNIISLLSTITFDDRTTDTMEFDDFKYQNKYNVNITWIDFLESLFNKYNLTGSSYLIEKFNFDYVWFIDEYMRTSIYPTTHNRNDHIFEGNVVRSINRLLNLLNELRNVAEETENKYMMNIFEECKIELLRDKAWLVPDSIYLRKCGFTLETNGDLRIGRTDNSNFDEIFDV